MSRSALLILLGEILGASLIVAGLAMISVPFSLIAAGIMIVVFAVAVERFSA